MQISKNHRKNSFQSPKARSGLHYKWLISLTLVAFCFFIFHQDLSVDAFIKFGYILNTTACDTCDELKTYSGRNVFCCLAQSKCCGPNSLDELDALNTTPAP